MSLALSQKKRNVLNHFFFYFLLRIFSQGVPKHASNAASVQQQQQLQDRRERNTAASARARLKKKVRVEGLAKTNDDLVAQNERLLRENRLAATHTSELQQKVAEYEAIFLLLGTNVETLRSQKKGKQEPETVGGSCCAGFKPAANISNTGGGNSKS